MQLNMYLRPYYSEGNPCIFTCITELAMEDTNLFFSDIFRCLKIKSEYHALLNISCKGEDFFPILCKVRLWAAVYPHLLWSIFSLHDGCSLYKRGKTKSFSALLRGNVCLYKLHITDYFYSYIEEFKRNDQRKN